MEDVRALNSRQSTQIPLFRTFQLLPISLKFGMMAVETAGPPASRANSPRQGKWKNI